MLVDFVRWLMRHRWVALGAMLAVTVGLGVFAARVGVDNAVDVWFVEGDDTLTSYREFQETYGNDEVVAIAVRDERGIWRPESLNALREATAALEDIDGIERVLGVTTAQLILTRPDETGGIAAEVLEVRPAMTGPVDEAGAAKLRRLVEADPLLEGRLVTGDGTIALLYAQMEALGDIDAQRNRILVELRERLDATLDRPVYVTGIGVVYNALNQISQTEGGLFMGVAFAVMFLLLWPLFRSLAAVGVSILAVACALVMTRGLYGLAGNDDNMVTLTLPVLVLILGVADCVHILRYFASRPDAPREETLASILRPCLYTTLTTMVGFLALATSRMAVVRDLGIFSAAGIGLAFLCSVITCAFALSFPRFQVRRPSEGGGGLGRLLAATSRIAVGRREAVLGVTCLIVLVSAYGLSKVSVDTFSLGFLASDHPVRQDSEAIEQMVGPVTPLEIVVHATGDQPEPIKDPGILRGVLAFERAIVADPEVRDAFGLADVTARLHQVNAGPGTPLEVPDDPFMVAENLEIYAGDADNQLNQLADDAWRSLRVTLSVPVLSAAGYRDLITRVRTVAEQHLPPNARFEASGYLPLYVKMMDYVVESQVSSFGLAFVVVFFLIGLLFRSVKMTALAVLPNVLPVFVTLGIMGYADIHLDVATVTITSIIIGIVVDDTIHYLHRFREELAVDGDFEQAAARTAIGVGNAIGATTLIFAAGFAILALASVKSIVYFGVLSALAMVVALLGDLFILPAILVMLKPQLVRREALA